MDHDYELEEDYPRVLWGRIAFFVVALLLAFLLGKCTTSGGADQEAFDERGKQIAELTKQNDLLQQKLAAAATEPPAGGRKRQATEAPDEGTEEPVSGDGEKYEVKSGDTLYGIAEKVYGEATKASVISDANNLSSDTPLRVGQVLIIPPEPPDE